MRSPLTLLAPAVLAGLCLWVLALVGTGRDVPRQLLLAMVVTALTVAAGGLVRLLT